jgi:hypothetical protein
MTREKDIVLIYFEEQPLFFARVESILADSKPDWYHVQLLMLQVPLTMVTWILRDVYINGERFTMDGKQIRLERVVAPEAGTTSDEDAQSPSSGQTEPQKTAGTKVISFTDKKR